MAIAAVMAVTVVMIMAVAVTIVIAVVTTVAVVTAIVARLLDRVEAPQHEIMHGAAGLRQAVAVDLLHVAGHRVGDAVVVGLGIAQEGGEIAHGGEAEPGHHRVLGDIGELVERGRAEGWRHAELAGGELHRLQGRVGIGPGRGRQQHRRVAVIGADAELRLRLIGAVRRICQRQRRRRAVGVDDELLGGRAGDRRAVAVLRHREGDAESRRRRALQHGGVPGGFDQREALIHQEAVARAARRRGVVAWAAVVEGAHGERAAAIGQVHEDAVIALRQIDRANDLEVGRVAHRAVRIARRELDIDDDGVLWVVRVDFAADLAFDPLILPGRPEAGAAEGRRLHGGDRHLRHARVRRREAAEGERAGDGECEAAGISSGRPNIRVHEVPPEKYAQVAVCFDVLQRELFSERHGRRAIMRRPWSPEASLG